MNNEQMAVEIEKLLEKSVVDALEVRFSDYKLPTPSDEISSQLESLSVLRSKLDQVDEILINVMRLRAKLRRESFDASNQAEAAWDAALDKVLKNPAPRGGDYVGAKAQASEANLATIAERRFANLKQRLVMAADSSYEVVRKIHSDLDSARHDLLAVVKSRPFEQSLDR